MSDDMINHLCRAAVLSSLRSAWREFTHLIITLSMRLWHLSIVSYVGISALLSELSSGDDANWGK